MQQEATVVTVQPLGGVVIDEPLDVDLMFVRFRVLRNSEAERVKVVIKEPDWLAGLQPLGSLDGSQIERGEFAVIASNLLTAKPTFSISHESTTV